MINHSNCDHPSTSGARAKCRRGSGGGSTPRPERKKMGATPRELDDDNYGQTPNRRDMECHKCGVERIGYRGTDFLSGILLYVGDKCRWYIKDAADYEVVEKL